MYFFSQLCFLCEVRTVYELWFIHDGSIRLPRKLFLQSLCVSLLPYCYPTLRNSRFRLLRLSKIVFFEFSNFREFADHLKFLGSLEILCKVFQLLEIFCSKIHNFWKLFTQSLSTFGNFLFKVFQLLEILCLKFPNFWKFSAQRFSTFGNFLPKVFQLLEILCLKSSNFWKFSAQSLPTFGNFLLKDFQLLEIFCPKFSNFWKFSA